MNIHRWGVLRACGTVKTVSRPIHCMLLRENHWLCSTEEDSLIVYCDVPLQLSHVHSEGGDFLFQLIRVHSKGTSYSKAWCTFRRTGSASTLKSGPAEDWLVVLSAHPLTFSLQHKDGSYLDFNILSTAQGQLRMNSTMKEQHSVIFLC